MTLPARRHSLANERIDDTSESRPHRVDDDSMQEAVLESLHLVHVQGWTLRKAVALTWACPMLVAKSKRQTSAMKIYVPTPEMIRQQCDEFRRDNPRHHHSYGASGSSTKEKAIREYSVSESSAGFTFEST